ncbi:aquaporin [Streptomyces sp. NPDC012950]|uniref:aquaporin n=1 Tax=Streptomyces sp. NPDC012950 TaxID=3364858 RepID=UPI00368574B3
MEAPLRRRALAELVGTAALVAVVVGSGIQAAGLTQDVAVRLLANALATVFGLGVLIALLGPVSGAHFNPAVTLALWWTGRRDGTGPTPRDVAAYLPAQTLGAVGGAVLAHAMFAGPLVSPSTHDRSAGHLWLAETVATGGLVLLVLGLGRTGRRHLAPVLVASYVGTAYWATSSTGFANPAVTVGRAFSDTFAGIAPSSVPPFVASQLLGACAGAALAAALFGRTPETGRTPEVGRTPETGRAPQSGPAPAPAPVPAPTREVPT